ncbi:YbaN family protein [Paenirhodobacter enshiensis]|uniref:YbaN family protein n=1 Tax=Paenirhodobacter enshiensis TaxID=1105367 RepID=UPI0006896001|nr:YbaN family protein [Paenirhodobacter enshiensis]
MSRSDNIVIRVLFLALGGMFVLLGFVGAFLPVLPTVPFLILAAGCFARSSERLENWLLSHRHFGPLLSDWRERGAIPRRAKLLALAGSGAGFVLFVWGRAPGWPLGLAVGAVIAGAMLYVFSRPDA